MTSDSVGFLPPLNECNGYAMLRGAGKSGASYPLLGELLSLSTALGLLSWKGRFLGALRELQR